MIEPMSGRTHLKTLLYARYTSFYRSLIESCKFPVRFLARICERDHRTVLGNTLSHLKFLCNEPDLSMLNPSLVKRNLKYMLPPDNELWRIELARELITARNDNIPGFTPAEIEDMLAFVCTS